MQKFKTYEQAYQYIINEIDKNGIMEDEETHLSEYTGETPTVRGRYETDGKPAPAKRVLNIGFTLDNSTDIAHVLYSKRQAVKDPITELAWIWLEQSNSVPKLQEMGCNVWNQWQREGEEIIDETGVNIGKGTIGKAYGYQLGNKFRKIPADEVAHQMLRNGELRHYPNPAEMKELPDPVLMNQLEATIYTLRTQPLSRRIKTTLFNFEDLDEMALEPCVYETHWQMFGGKLHLTVTIRSNDMALGNPYNVMQYTTFHRMVAEATGIPAGDITFVIQNAHVYGRHLEDIKSQIASYNEMLKEDYEEAKSSGHTNMTFDEYRYERETRATSHFKNFPENIYDFNVGEHFEVVDYNVPKERRYRYEIVV